MAEPAAETLPAPPVFIVAPTRRCGTTLLQRAFNSSPSAIIYGENFAFLEAYPALVPGVNDNIPLRKARTREVRRQVLAGNYDIDASAMFPDYLGYVKVMRDQVQRIAEYYRSQSLAAGRPVWGLKHQIRQAESFAAFMRCLPAARYIFVYRNIFDVARSERARFSHEYPDPQSFARLGRVWAQNMEFMRSRRTDNVLHLEYADMGKDVAALIARIEGHCGVTGIKPEVFERRINVSPLLDRLSPDEARTGYRPPESLSAEEFEALRGAAGGHCRRFGYAVPAG
jgi:hypothetical protein